MTLQFKKKKYLKEINRYLSMMNKSNFNEEYLKSKGKHISCLRWLKAYYEGRAASTPKQLMEISLKKGGNDIWVNILYW